MPFIFYLLAVLGVIVSAVGVIYGLNAKVFLYILPFIGSTLVAAALFGAIGYALSRLDDIRYLLRDANAMRQRKPRHMPQLYLDELAAPVRVLRSLGDVLGGLNDAQREAVTAFVADSNGLTLSAEEKVDVARWSEMTMGKIADDLAQLSAMSAASKARFRKAVSAVVAKNSAYEPERKQRIEQARDNILKVLCS